MSDQISLGDSQSNYLLTTAENELGVVAARSDAGRDLAVLPPVCLSSSLSTWRIMISGRGTPNIWCPRDADGAHQLV